MSPESIATPTLPPDRRGPKGVATECQNGVCLAISIRASPQASSGSHRGRVRHRRAIASRGGRAGRRDVRGCRQDSPHSSQGRFDRAARGARCADCPLQARIEMFPVKHFTQVAQSTDEFPCQEDVSRMCACGRQRTRPNQRNCRLCNAETNRKSRARKKLEVRELQELVRKNFKG